MPKPLTATLATAIVLAGMSVAGAAERTVTLRLANMTCAGCAFIVKRTLARMDGVAEAVIVYDKRIAVVRYDDRLVTPAGLTAATAKAGFPSRIATQAQR